MNIGTIRLLNNQLNKADWNYLKSYVKEMVQHHHPVTGIGSGGNINRIFKLSEEPLNKPLTFKKLKEVNQRLNSFTLEQRITVLGLNTDRADVIIPAARIFISIMKTAEIRKLYVPQIGLSDGIVHLLYEDYKRKNSERIPESSFVAIELFNYTRDVDNDISLFLAS